LSRIFHENLFFNYFYAQALCLDQPELVLMTSRSRSYYVSAAYWARDACLWSFPGLLLVDARQARRALQAMLMRYLPHAAQHALYLNGQALYPGFELDEACAPLIALEHYLRLTGKRELLEQPWLPAALSQIYETLSGQFDPQTGLYATLLTSHDDPTDYPYLTYDNVLVWRALNILADLDDTGATHYRSASHLKRATHLKSASTLRQQAEKLKAAILKQCVRDGPFGLQFVAAVDAQGGCDWNDLPGGSWSLFPYYGFCTADDPLYLNSLKWIYSEHNPHYYPGPFGGAGAAHFPFPSCFDLANRLLRKDPAAVEQLKQLALDHGLACESFDPQTGVVRTGAAFATLAGFLAYAIQAR
jgi:meiotically up-regulated gene 157 (Mug157) protein